MITSVRRHVHRLVVTSVVISPHTPAGTRIHLGSSRESGSMTVCRCRVCRIRSARLVFKDHNPALAVQGKKRQAQGPPSVALPLGAETEPHLRHVSSPRERVLAASVHVSLTFPYIRYHNHHLPSRLLEAQVRSYQDLDHMISPSRCWSAFASCTRAKPRMPLGSGIWHDMTLMSQPKYRSRKTCNAMASSRVPSNAS